ncbi:uncharacterized protein LOC143034854 [Oratosquilla oratoria]|uniref:uncharacterized protein LOC143034854 n=1 Tax=Oratosquilla oratoria TaxID=337810 RepID=UPI003F759129
MAPTPNGEGGCQGAEGEVRSQRIVRLNINGTFYRVDPDVPKTTTLLSFIRNYAKLSGTKAVCDEGGCGACTVVATVRDFEMKQFKSFSIQACQALVYACSNWRIETIEHLGDRYKGYDSLQTRLHMFYGTQCGFCSPGMIMTMHGQMKSKGKLKAEEVDQLLDGNLCRCTGYRPIVDAFKSLAEDAPQHLQEKLVDIEDTYKAMCPHTGEKCKGSCKPKDENRNSIDYCSDEEDLVIVEEGELGASWYKLQNLQRVYNILSKKDPRMKHRIVVGNTGQGVYKEDGPYNMYINTTSIKKLYHVSTKAPLVIGANVSLARVIEVFELTAKSWQGYQHLENLAQHWRVVANVAVRNVGSWAGNLMMKHQHNEFPSDIFLTLLAVETKITIADAAAGGQTSTVTLEEFLNEDMDRKLILSMTIPALPENTHVRSFKITPRAVNAHAYENAVFVLRTDPNDDFRVLTRPTVVLSGIRSAFVRATETEKALYGKRLTAKSLVSFASQVLGNEIKPDDRPIDSSPKYRKELAQCLLFKTILGIVGTKADAAIQSGGKDPETSSYPSVIYLLFKRSQGVFMLAVIEVDPRVAGRDIDRASPIIIPGTLMTSANHSDGSVGESAIEGLTEEVHASTPEGYSKGLWPAIHYSHYGTRILLLRN